jgi:hypothetical protein
MAAPAQPDFWEFTAHLFPHGTRWSWTRFDHAEEPRQQSPVTFPSFMAAMANATRCGFRRNDRFVLAAVDISHGSRAGAARRYGVKVGGPEWPRGVAVV